MEDESLKQKVADYRPSQTALEVLRKTPILLLSAISGAGKDSVRERLLEKYGDNYHLIVSHTTRRPRLNHGRAEQNGVDYHFIDLPAAKKMLEEHAYIEANYYAGNIYGTSLAEIQQADADNRIAITDLTVDGADDYVELTPTVKPVFLFPPSYEEWMRRLMSRAGNTADPADLTSRMETAIREIEHAVAQKHFYIVINDDLEKTVELVHDIANGKTVEPHYQKAMTIAEHLLKRLREEVAKRI